MSEYNTSRHCWSWRTCFAPMKNSKKKVKIRKNHLTPQKAVGSNDHHTDSQFMQRVDENSNILFDHNFSSKNTKLNQNNPLLVSNTHNATDKTVTNINEHDLIHDNAMEQSFNDIQAEMMAENFLSTMRTTPLDVIEEDLNEENFDELDETLQSAKLCCDNKLMNDLNHFYSRLFELSKTNHIIIKFNNKIDLHDDFIRQLDKLKIKINDIKRTDTGVSYQAELLEARYSTLLTTMENLSLFLRLSQLSSFGSLVNRLMALIEQRMEELHRTTQISLPVNTHEQDLDVNDDDPPSFYSAVSSYEQISRMP